MSSRFRLVLAVLAAALVFTSGMLVAQTRLTEREYRMLSGSDVGFRIEGTDANGHPVGRLMIRVDGRWVEPAAAPTLRRATE